VERTGSLASKKVPGAIYLFLAVGLVAASQSGNIVRLGNAHPVAIVAWRLLLASLFMALLAGPRLAEISRLKWRQRSMLALAGTALAGHLIAWVAAVQLTTVANAAIFFAVNPILTALAARLFLREQLTARRLLAATLGLAGVGVVGLGELQLSVDSLAGDGLALFCSVLFTAYFLLGKRLREQVDARAYVAGVYGSAAAVSLVALVVLGLPVFDYDRRTWLCFALMALVPTIIGHTSFNVALCYLDSSWIATATLSEPLLAGVVAFFAWGETLPSTAAAGYVLISASVLVLAFERRSPRAAGGPG
jgi:drug/metabolite transporter (DMT)-like permease